MLEFFTDSGRRMSSLSMSFGITQESNESLDGFDSMNNTVTHQMTKELKKDSIISLPPKPCFPADIDVANECPLFSSEREGVIESSRSSNNNKTSESSIINKDNSSNNNNDSSNTNNSQNKANKSYIARTSRSDKQSCTNLFISNIPHSLDQSDLDKLFSPFGKIVSSAVMRNIHTGASLGNAFVRYGSSEEAERAFAEMAGKRICGRAISIQWAKKQHDDTPIGEARKKIFKLFVRNIPLDICINELSQMFALYGPVKAVSIHKDTAPDTEKNSERHIAFITYLVEGAAERAAEAVHNTRPFPSCGKVPLMVKLAEEFPQHSNNNNDANGLNNNMRGNKPMHREMGRSLHMQDGTSRNSLISGGCAQFANGTTGVPMAGGSSHFFAPMAGAGGFLLPSTIPGGVGMGARSEQTYSVGAPIIWPSRAGGAPVHFFNGIFTTTTAEPSAFNNAVSAPYYQQPVSVIGSNGMAPLQMYTTQFLPLATDLNAQQVDGMAGAPHVFDFSAFVPSVASGACPPGVISYAALVPAPPPTAVVPIAEQVAPEFHWTAEQQAQAQAQAPLVAGGISAGCSVAKPPQTNNATTTAAPASDTFGNIMFFGGITPL